MAHPGRNLDGPSALKDNHGSLGIHPGRWRHRRGHLGPTWLASGLWLGPDGARLLTKVPRMRPACDQDAPRVARMPRMRPACAQEAPRMRPGWAACVQHVPRMRPACAQGAQDVLSMRCDAIWYDTIPYTAVIQYYAIPCDAIRYDKIRYDAIRCDVMRYDKI